MRPGAGRTLEILRALCAAELGTRELTQLHEALLFYKAYPRSPELYRFCASELRGFGRRITSLDDSSRTEFDQTGIAGSRCFYAYDYGNARRLVKWLGQGADIDWSEYEAKDSDPLGSLLPSLVTSVEADGLDDPETSSREFVEFARGKRTSLEWLLDRIRTTHPPAHAEHVYTALDLPLVATLPAAGPARTSIEDGAPRKLFVWEPQAARAKFEFVTECRRPLKLPKPVSVKRGRELFELLHKTLLVRLRELYPLTYGNPAEVYDVQLERGIRIVFWFMLPAKRLPLEAGWDFMMLKNNVPIAYGGGGMLGDRSEHAINVFETFRGGEAAWLFAQVSRVAFALGRAPWIVTRKYQLGGDGNEEGISSGSYWFYDKLGFRSVDAAVRKLADQERSKIAKTPSYRTPKSILRRFAKADVVLSLDGRPASEYREYPLGKVGLSAARSLAEHGGPARILRECARRYGLDYSTWTTNERKRGGEMLAWVLALPEFERWSASERRNVFELCRLKGSLHEADYAAALGRNLKFAEAVKQNAKTLKYRKPISPLDPPTGCGGKTDSDSGGDAVFAQQRRFRTHLCPPVNGGRPDR